MTPEEMQDQLAMLQADVDVAIALARSMHAHAEVCETRGYRISSGGLKIYAERIMEVLCASKEQGK